MTEGIVKVACNLPADLETLDIIGDDYFSEYIIQNNIMPVFDEVEVRRAYYLTEYNKLIPAFVKSIRI